MIKESYMEVSNYHKISSGCLLGSFDVFIKHWGLRIFQCKLFGKDGRRWIVFPTRQYETRSGEKKHLEYISMRKDKKAKFDESCIKLLDQLVAQDTGSDDYAF